MIVMLDPRGSVVYGPAPWSHGAVLEPLLVAGYDLLEGVLHGPDGLPLSGFPAEEPGARIQLGGFTVLPVIEIHEEVPEGKVMAGRGPVILEDRVEMQPVWTEIPPPPAPPSLSEARAVKQVEIRDKADALLMQLVSEYPLAERSTWETQQAEALSLQADPASAAPLLRAMAAERGVSPEYLAGRVCYHAARWKAMAGPVIGQRQKFQDLLDAARDVESVEAITVRYVLQEA